MPEQTLEKKDWLPKGCSQESADAIYEYFKTLFDACLDDTCRDSIRDQYAQAHETCTVPNGA